MNFSTRRRTCDICPGDFGRIPSAEDSTLLRTGRPMLDPVELHWYAPHKPGWCLTTKLPMRDAAGNIVGLIGISRDVRAPIETSDIPVEFAAALEHFENDVTASVTPSALARRARLAPHRFARLMKRFFGLTPSQFIAKARIALPHGCCGRRIRPWPTSRWPAASTTTAPSRERSLR